MLRFSPTTDVGLQVVVEDANDTYVTAIFST